MSRKTVEPISGEGAIGPLVLRDQITIEKVHFCPAEVTKTDFTRSNRMIRNKLALFAALPFGLAAGILAISFVRKIFRLPITFSFAQGAEDIILPYIATYNLGLSRPGTYIDVGCNTPVRFSNTFELYLRGWRGINIDANRDLIREFQRVRKKDVCICAAVSDSEKEVIFHKAKDDAVSTIDEDRLVQWKKHFEFSPEDQEQVITRTLTSILDEHWRGDNSIDVLSIDVEGHDFQVLKGLDLVKYRPKIIVIEMHTFEAIEESEIYQYLTSKNYRLNYFAVLNAYFVDNKVNAPV